MAFIVALVLLVAFTANVAIGAVGDPVVGNVAEMILLLATSCAFVVGILQREKKARNDPKTDR